MAYSFEPYTPDISYTLNAGNFADIALSVFRHQYVNNTLYQQFCNAIGRHPDNVGHITDIPFLPISFFKTHSVKTGNWPEPELIFESSGTTGEVPSRHLVASEEVYLHSLLEGFQYFYGPPSDYAILALLPSYLERQNASLVHMAKVLMAESGHADCGFYLNEWAQLQTALQRLEAQGQKTLLLGVTFALLDFAAAHPMELQHTIVMETGGMKGRREEWTRAQVHDYLKQQWQLPHVHSEYGMTELLSQAYALKNGIFQPTPTMRALVRDVNDPLDVRVQGTGCLNIIDLANIYSCAFIATDDIGHLHTDGSFEVLGRTDHSALRGCSLMTV